MSKKPYDPFRTWLTRPVRLGIMFFLITVFLILSPLILLYTTGWRWNFTTWQAESTGVLSIDTLPEDAQIFLNDRLIGTEQPIKLTSLVPGIYRVRINQDGYHAFATDVTVRSHETSYIRNTTLFKKNTPTLLTTSTDTFFQLGISAINPLAYHFVSRKSGSSTLHIVINNQSTDFPILETNNLDCARAKNYCLLSSNTGTIKIINTLNPSNPKNLQLKTVRGLQLNEEKNEPLFYVQTNNEILSIDSESISKSMGTVSSTVWFVDAEQAVWAYNTSTLYARGQTAQAVSVPSTVTKIISVRNNYALLRTTEGLVEVTGLNSNPGVDTLFNYYSHRYHTATAEWRLWSPWEISSVYDRTGDRAILYRSAAAIQFVEALEPAGVLLIAQDNKLIAFNPGYYASQELAAFDSISDLDTDETNRLILIAGSRQGQSGIFSLSY